MNINSTQIKSNIKFVRYLEKLTNNQAHGQQSIFLPAQNSNYSSTLFTNCNPPSRPIKETRFPNIGEVLKQLENEVERGSTKAMVKLADLYLNEFCLSDLHDKAISLYLKATKFSNEAKIRLKNCYLLALKPAFAPTDNVTAKEENTNVTVRLAACCNFPYKEDLDIQNIQAIHIMTSYLKAANAGDTQKMVKLGDICLFSGQKNLMGDAIYWYQKAADAGNTEAMIKLADLYLTEFCLSDLHDKAISLYLKAAEAGDSKAKIWLEYFGFLYSNLTSLFSHKEVITTADDNKIRQAKYRIDLYRKEANGGDTTAMVRVGDICLQSGQFRLMYWAIASYKKAAEAGNSDAIIRLGDCYNTGSDPKLFDIANAIFYYEKADNEGNEQASIRLSKLPYFTHLFKGSPKTIWPPLNTFGFESITPSNDEILFRLKELVIIDNIYAIKETLFEKYKILFCDTITELTSRILFKELKIVQFRNLIEIIVNEVKVNGSFTKMAIVAKLKAEGFPIAEFIIEELQSWLEHIKKTSGVE